MPLLFPFEPLRGRRCRVLAAVVGALLATVSAHAEEPRTLRLEYVHSGDASGESFALSRLILEGPWPGPLDRRLDETNLGRYRFEVRDRATNRVLYSRGFASVYGEWESTGEAKELRRAFTESLRFPEPTGPVQVLIEKRDRRQAFQQVFSLVVDPRAASVERAAAPASARVWAVQESGPPRDKVDLLLLGDGYTAAEMDKWHADARRLTEMLFREPPFRERRSAFNVWAIDAPADESGVSRPSEGVYRRSPFAATYDAFGSERYVLAFDERWRELAAKAPYEFVEIVVNGRKYGGGGIHNLYATVAADNAFTPYVFVHEFGHHFAGLADEYYTSDVAYEAGARVEPWERNATADPRASKWADLIPAGAVLPTPWAKSEFEAIEKEIQGQASRDPRRRPARGGDGGSIPRGERAHGEAPGRGPARPGGRRLRGCALRSEGLLPAARRLHHVHAQQRGLLPRLPARARAGDRSVRSLKGG